MQKTATQRHMWENEVKASRRVQGTPTLRVISLGGGVQSTVMTLLAEEGAFDKPDCAIFADTKWEPKQVYENVAWLKEQVSFPVYVTSFRDRSLFDDVWNGKGQYDHDFVTIPVYIGGGKGEKRQGMSMRQCTKGYKITPVKNKIRELLGLKPRKHYPKGTQVEIMMGLSLDEIQRVKPSQFNWATNRYPLIDDLEMTRDDCKEWFKERYPDRELVKSACIGCPYRSSKNWVNVYENDPEGFARTVELDDRLRSDDHIASKLFKRPIYLHGRSLPLREAIELDIMEIEEKGDAFDEECEGYCGV